MQRARRRPASRARKRRRSLLWYARRRPSSCFDVLASCSSCRRSRPAQPGATCAFPVCFINGNLEFPAPHGSGSADGAAPMTGIVSFQVEHQLDVLTLWIVGGHRARWSVVPVMRRARGGPGPPPELRRVGVRVDARLRHVARRAPGARRYIPIFAAFFLLILFSNWAGLLPPVGQGRVPARARPATSTSPSAWPSSPSSSSRSRASAGSASRGYLGKFFPFYEFKNGIGAGLIAMFVGLIELLLELVKPLTLSMRLFGNIYGGEVALGVDHAR